MKEECNECDILVRTADQVSLLRLKYKNYNVLLPKERKESSHVEL